MDIVITPGSQHISVSEYNQISSIVKEDLSAHNYSKITYKQHKTMQKHSNHIISAYVSSEYTGNKIVPKVIICLILKHTFDPLHYRGDNCISLQSSQPKNADIFIIPTESCKPSKYLKQSIRLKFTKAFLLNGVKQEILELFVKYIADVYTKAVLVRNLRGNQSNDDYPFIDNLDENTLLDLLSVAISVDNYSLVKMIRKRIDILNGITEEQRHALLIQSLCSHFDT